MKFFRISLLRKQVSERLSCLYIQWVAYRYKICKECLWIKSLVAPKFLVYRRKIRGSETIFRLILSEKKSFPLKTIHQLSISEVKILLVTGNIYRAYKVRNLFCLDDRQKSRHFFKRLAHSQKLHMLITFFRSEYTSS